MPHGCTDQSCDFGHRGGNGIGGVEGAADPPGQAMHRQLRQPEGRGGVKHAAPPGHHRHQMPPVQRPFDEPEFARMPRPDAVDRAGAQQRKRGFAPLQGVFHGDLARRITLARCDARLMLVDRVRIVREAIAGFKPAPRRIGIDRGGGNHAERADIRLRGHEVIGIGGVIGQRIKHRIGPADLPDQRRPAGARLMPDHPQCRQFRRQIPPAAHHSRHLPAGPRQFRRRRPPDLARGPEYHRPHHASCLRIAPDGRILAPNPGL